MPRINFQARLRAKKKQSPAVVFFTTADSRTKGDRPCVYVACLVGGAKVGPIWGHKKASIDRALATLTKTCDCPAKYHKAMEFSGEPQEA